MDALVQKATGEASAAAEPPLRIGYLVPEFPSQTHAFFWREVQGLRAIGVDVRLLSTRRPSEPSPHEFSAAAMKQTHYLFPPNWLNTVRFLSGRPKATTRALRYIMALTESSSIERLKILAMLPSACELATFCDIEQVSHVHIHSFANAMHIGAMANILAGVPYSAVLHGDLPVYGTDHARKLDRASFAVAVTRPLVEQIARVSDTKTHEISMGVDVERFTPAPARPDAHAGPLRAISVTRLNRMKGHAFFLEAMARLVAEGIDIQYSIAGEGPHREEIEATIRRLGLDERVRLLGAVSDERVLDMLHRSDVLVLSSHLQGEAAPVAVMEAMACGLPVICSRIGGTPDMIEDGVDGLLVAQRDIDALAQATRLLASDPLERARLGLAARQTACRKFDYRIKAAQLAAAIRQSINS